VLLAAIGLYLLWLTTLEHDSGFLWTGVLLGVISLLPLLPWTVRNWRTLHQIEPLSPFYAQLPGEYVPVGFNRWSKTWVIDFISVMDVYWNVSSEGNGERVDIQDIPPRAFDDPQQRTRTDQIFAGYNQTLLLTPEMDAEFAQLAAERIHSHPLRYYLGLPLARLADMWVRPRTEMLNLELNWWDWQDVSKESSISACLAALDVFYIVAALLSFRWRMQGAGILWLFILCRSALLATLPNPEPRYTLECFPALFILAAVGLTRGVGAPRRH
jgi:hypothetical protein